MLPFNLSLLSSRSRMNMENILNSPQELFGSMSLQVDEKKLNEFIGRSVGELGAAMGSLLNFVGDRLGLFKAMAGAGPMSAEELARKTGTHARIMREWLAAQAAGGVVTYDSASGK